MAFVIFLARMTQLGGFVLFTDLIRRLISFEPAINSCQIKVESYKVRKLLCEFKS